MIMIVSLLYFLHFLDHSNSFILTKLDKAHSDGINTISWGPPFNMSFYNNVDDFEEECNKKSPRFCTGGNDKLIRIWKYEKGDKGNKLIEESRLPTEHSSSVRDVAWLKYLGARYDTIASGGEDNNLFIYQLKDNAWKKVFDKNFQYPIFSVSWSNCGTYLACSCGDNQIYVFVENLSQEWELISKVDDNGNLQSENLNN